MNDKLLSISIASYNVEEYLEETLESLVLESSYMDRLEIIIVNDGSTDSTQEIAENFRRRYPDTVRIINKSNGGYGSTINEAVRASEGKYFKLLDGDDRFDGRSLGMLIDLLEEGETADLILSTWVITREGRQGRELVDKHPKLAPSPHKIENASFGDGIAMFEICIRTELLVRRGVSITENCFYTDNEFVMTAILASSTVQKFEHPLYCYRLGVEGQSVSVEGQRKHYRDCIRAFAAVAAQYEAYSGPITGGRASAVSALISVLMRFTYIAHMLQKSPLHYRAELKAFDDRMRSEYPRAYELTGGSRLVRIIRHSGPLLYSMLAGVILKRETERTR